MSDKEERKKKLERFFAMGVVLIVGSLIIRSIPTLFLGSINERIALLELEGSPTQQHQVMLDELLWSKIWWETKQTTVFDPIAKILLVIGIVLIAYGLIVRFA